MPAWEWAFIRGSLLFAFFPARWGSLCLPGWRAGVSKETAAGGPGLGVASCLSRGIGGHGKLKDGWHFRGVEGVTSSAQAAIGETLTGRLPLWGESVGRHGLAGLWEL